MIEALLFLTAGAILGLFASCVADAFTTWRTRRRNRLEMARRLRQPGWAFLPPTFPTKKD